MNDYFEIIEVSKSIRILFRVAFHKLKASPSMTIEQMTDEDKADSLRWIDLEVMRKLEPKWKFADFIEGIYMYETFSVYRRLYIKALRVYKIDLTREYITRECENVRMQKIETQNKRSRGK